MSKSIGQEIKTSIENLDYNAVCRLTQYVKDSFATIDEAETMKFSIQFKMGEISITVEDYNEFCKVAYGQVIDVIDIMLSNYRYSTYVNIKPYNNNFQMIASISVLCDEISILRKMVEKIEEKLVLNNVLLQNQNTDILKGQSNPQSVSTSTAAQVIVNVSGNLNMNKSTIGNNNDIKNNDKETDVVDKGIITPKKGLGFWEGVWQQVVANWIWWLLGVIGITVWGYLGLV